MKKQFRFSRVLAAVTLLVAGTIILQPRILAQMGLDFWNLPKLNREIETIEENQEELQEKSELVQQHIVIKNRLVQRLADGRLDLLSAASFFRNLNADHEEYMEVMRRRYNGRSDDECICLNVIEYASCTLYGRPEHAAVVRRLQAEFEQLRRAGVVQLPA